MWLHGEWRPPAERGRLGGGVLSRQGNAMPQCQAAFPGRAPSTSAACRSWQDAWAWKEPRNAPEGLSQQDSGWVFFWHQEAGRDE